MTAGLWPVAAALPINGAGDRKLVLALGCHCHTFLVRQNLMHNNAQGAGLAQPRRNLVGARNSPSTETKSLAVI